MARATGFIMRKMIVERGSIALLALGFSFSAAAVEQQRGAEDTAGEALYQTHCAQCHDNPQNNTPPRAALAYRSPGSVERSLTDGIMKSMASKLNAQEIRSLAVLLTGREPGPPVEVMANACQAKPKPLALSSSDWAGSGGDLENSRYSTGTSITAANISRLKPKWVFGIPGGAPGTVALAGNRLFLATGTGHVMSLDAESGCAHWAYDTKGKLVRRVTVAAVGDAGSQIAVFFGDAKGGMTALDAVTGKLLWHTRVEHHALARITASPSVYDGRVYVPVSSIEDPLTHDPSYSCCTFRGSVVALDAATGNKLWQSYNISEENRLLAPATDEKPAQYGPAGAAVYLPLAIDRKRQLVYASTAESYTYDNPEGAYSVIAYDLKTGERHWQQQFLPSPKEREQVCAEVGYTDCRNLFSMGTAVTIYSQPGGKQRLLVAQKSGDVYALDPDAKGRIIWHNKASFGGDLGGIMYGMSAAKGTVYVPVSDAYVEPPRQAGGLVAIDVNSGKTRWKIAAPDAACNWTEDECDAAVVAASTKLPGAILLGHNDGHLRAYASNDGELIWDTDTAKGYQTINGVGARGGQVNGFPVIVADKAVYVVSGAASQARPGNALLMYTLDGK